MATSLSIDRVEGCILLLLTSLIYGGVHGGVTIGLLERVVGGGEDIFVCPAYSMGGVSG